MDAEFMEMLTELRVRYAKPLVVTSAYRHPSHPIEARKSKPGAHTTGKAVDLAVQYGDAYTILGIAMMMGFTGIGVQQKGSGRFIHLDTCTEKNGFPRPTIWSY
jgi:uncharacterized protein YcbK (DUF882 family)